MDKSNSHAPSEEEDDSSHGSGVSLPAVERTEVLSDLEQLLVDAEDQGALLRVRAELSASAASLAQAPLPEIAENGDDEESPDAHDDQRSTARPGRMESVRSATEIIDRHELNDLLMAGTRSDGPEAMDETLPRSPGGLQLSPETLAMLDRELEPSKAPPAMPHQAWPPAAAPLSEPAASPSPAPAAESEHARRLALEYILTCVLALLDADEADTARHVIQAALKR